MKRSILALCILLLSVYGINAQKLSIENVYEVTLRNADVIKQGGEIKGYYFFYVSDKVDKKNNEYTLRITDNKLKKLKDIKFQDSKDVTIINASFNGSELIFVLHYLKEDKLEYKIYGTDGNSKYNYSTPLKPLMGGFFKKAANEIEDEIKEQLYGELYAVGDKGFISKKTERGGLTFSLNFFSSKKNKEWSFSPTGNEKIFSATILGSSANVIYINVLKLKKAFDREPESSLMGLDIETGKTIFENPTNRVNYKFLPAKISALNDKKAIIYGESFNTSASVLKDKSTGFAFWEIDEKGNVLKEKQFSWENTFKQYFNISSGGKIDDFGYLFIHEIIQTDDGSLFLIGEGYKTSGTRTYTTDMMLIQIDKDFIVKDAKIYLKQSNAVSLDGGGAFMGAQAKGYAIKFDNRFDYAYSIANGNNSSFSILYSDYVRSKDYKGITFNSITWYEGKITTDKINTKSDATISTVLPAIQGQLLIIDYYKKDKRLDVHFEKLN